MKRMTALILSILLLLPVLCCAKTPAAEPADSPSAEATDEPKTAYNAEFDPETDYDNRFGRTMSYHMTETEDAYYFIPFDSEKTYMYYSDKASGEYGVLCGKPECLHDGEDANTRCSGYLGQYPVTTCNYFNGKLYYVAFYNPNYRLCSMGLDGTDHETLIELPFAEDSRVQDFFVHRGKVYGTGLCDIVEKGVPLQSATCCCWDMQTGEYKLIFQEKNQYGARDPFLFFYGKYVYLCLTLFKGPRIGAPKIVRWDSELDRLETVFDPGDEFAWGDLFSCWVNGEDEIYLASEWGCDGTSEVYRISGGKIVDTLKFNEPGFIFLLDGITVNMDDGVQIMNYNGETLYDGELSKDFLYETLSPAEKNDTISFAGVYGGEDAIYVSYRTKNKVWIMRYELSGEELIPTLLFCGDKRFGAVY